MSLVYSGWSKEAPTKLCAAKWYISIGSLFFNASDIVLESMTSAEINSILSYMSR